MVAGKYEACHRDWQSGTCIGWNCLHGAVNLGQRRLDDFLILINTPASHHGRQLFQLVVRFHDFRVRYNPAYLKQYGAAFIPMQGFGEVKRHREQLRQLLILKNIFPITLVLFRFRGYAVYGVVRGMPAHVRVRVAACLFPNFLERALEHNDFAVYFKLALDGVVEVMLVAVLGFVGA